MGILAGCASGKRPGAPKIDNSLTEQQKAAGVFTPEVMWKMGRIGQTALSPDGRNVVYAVTYYDMADNRGISSLYIRTAEENTARLTDDGGNDSAPLFPFGQKRRYTVVENTRYRRFPRAGVECRGRHREFRHSAVGRQALLREEGAGRQHQVFGYI